MYFRKIILIDNQNQTHEIDLAKISSCDFQFQWTDAHINYQFHINKTSLEHLNDLIQLDEDFINLDNMDRFISQTS